MGPGSQDRSPGVLAALAAGGCQRLTLLKWMAQVAGFHRKRFVVDGADYFAVPDVVRLASYTSDTSNIRRECEYFIKTTRSPLV
jgi:hypothetical protein